MKSLMCNSNRQMFADCIFMLVIFVDCLKQLSRFLDPSRINLFSQLFTCSSFFALKTRGISSVQPSRSWPFCWWRFNWPARPPPELATRWGAHQLEKSQWFWLFLWGEKGRVRGGGWEIQSLEWIECFFCEKGSSKCFECALGMVRNGRTAWVFRLFWLPNQPAIH